LFCAAPVVIWKIFALLAAREKSEKAMALHTFIAMPFGVKEGIDFNKVYAEYIKPALENAGFAVFRADEEQRAGSIHTDMFQELLLADLVVVDLSIDNPNVWYELGVRHGLRARGVIQIQCQREYMPFDVQGERTARYHIKDGVPDPNFLKADQEKLATLATATIRSWHGRKISPVYQRLRFLQEPDWKSLRIEEAKEFWEAQEAWEARIEVARRGNRPGDILVFAEEAPTQALRLEAYRKAGKALLSLGQFAFALDQYEEALALDPTDLESRRQKGIILGRLKKHDEAKVWLTKVVEDHPDDAESLALLGRVGKDAWLTTWRADGRSTEEMRVAAAAEDALLREAIEPYAMGFQKDPSHYYSGINAVTLLHLLRHLTGAESKEGAQRRALMEGGVRWAIHSALAKSPKDYWARATLGDLETLVGEKNTIERAYKDALAVAEKDRFALDSSCQQLLLLKDLGFRPTEVAAAMQLFAAALKRLEPEKKRWNPRLVFLFSGHMIDAPDRPTPRFPADKELVAAQAIADQLEKLGAGPEDLAMCGGACGGDLLFAEACLERGLRLEVRLPFAEPEFLQASVAFAGDGWVERFHKVREHPQTRFLLMPEQLGPLPKGSNAFARNNLWQLYTALSWGPERVRFLCLWNRRGGDGPGGTQHMHDTVRKHSGRVFVLDTTLLW
jgi:tetratricopeptide (TPR) repeat protein